MIEAVPVGTRVEIGDERDSFNAEITALMVQSDNYVTYEVTWWNGRSRHSEWMTRGEFTVNASETEKQTRIGFNA